MKCHTNYLMTDSAPTTHQVYQGVYTSPKSKRREPYEVLLRRFNREIQISGLLTEIKRRRFFTKDQSRTIKRLSAIRKSTRKKQLRGY